MPKNWENLVILAKYAGVPVDIQKPRDSRKRVALELERRGEYFAALEAMTGDPAHTRNDYLDLIMLKNFGGQSAEEFYNGFPDVDREE